VGLALLIPDTDVRFRLVETVFMSLGRHIRRIYFICGLFKYAVRSSEYRFIASNDEIISVC
jgi:hypothetical protein